MMNALKVSLILCGFFMSSALLAAPETVELHLCRLKDSVRIVREIKSGDGRCMAVYSRDGKDQIVGNTSDRSECEQIKQNVLKNLSDGSYQCKVFVNPSFTFISGGENE